MEKIFETALRGKFRFEYKGLISTEDLYDLKIEQLDKIYSSLSDKLDIANKGSLLSNVRVNRTLEQELIDIKMQIVKYIFDVKVKEQEELKLAREKKEQKQKILALLDEKQNEELKNKSIDELKKMLENLE